MLYHVALIVNRQIWHLPSLLYGIVVPRKTLNRVIGSYETHLVSQLERKEEKETKKTVKRKDPARQFSHTNVFVVGLMWCPYRKIDKGLFLKSNALFSIAVSLME